MPSFARAADLLAFRKEALEEARMLRSASSRTGKDTFLSHASEDAALVPGAIALLEAHGGSVYVDLGDARLPDPPSVRTAVLLREAVRETRRFVLLVTEQSKGSIWIPWELGLADGEKAPGAVALLPVVELSTAWTEREYLGLYRRIARGRIEGYDLPMWLVYDHHENTASPLQEWLGKYY